MCNNARTGQNVRCHAHTGQGSTDLELFADSEKPHVVHAFSSDSSLVNMTLWADFQFMCLRSDVECYETFQQDTCEQKMAIDHDIMRC